MTQFEKSFHAALQECFPSEGFSYRSKSFFRWCPDIVQFFSVKWVRYQYTFSFGILPLSFKTLEFNDHVGYSLSKLRAEHIVLPSHIRLGDWTFPIPTKCCETGVLPSYMHLADWTTQELLDSDFAEVVNLVRLEVLPFFQKGQTVTGARAAVEEMNRKYFSAPNSLHEEIAMHFCLLSGDMQRAYSHIDRIIASRSQYGAQLYLAEQWKTLRRSFREDDESTIQSYLEEGTAYSKPFYDSLRHPPGRARKERRMELTDLPNIGPVLAENLRKIGVETPEAFREMGAEEAFLRIRRSVDNGACLHQLSALAGAELGLPKAALPPERKAALKAFFQETKKKERES